MAAEAPGDAPTDANPLQVAVALNILILVPLTLGGISLVVRAFPLLNGALLSLVPWGLFIMIFLFATWHYARRSRDPASWPRQMAKLARNGSVIVLLCLMPLAGVFDLATERGGLRDIGLALRGAMEREDAAGSPLPRVVMQYAVHRPSLYFYTLHGYVLLNGPQLPGVATRELDRDDTALHNAWKQRERVFLLIGQSQQPLSPLPEDVYSVAEGNGMVLLSNRMN